MQHIRSMFYTLRPTRQRTVAEVERITIYSSRMQRREVTACEAIHGNVLDHVASSTPEHVRDNVPESISSKQFDRMHQYKRGTT